jgi:hypothetical protein
VPSECTIVESKAIGAWAVEGSWGRKASYRSVNQLRRHQTKEKAT